MTGENNLFYCENLGVSRLVKTVLFGVREMQSSHFQAIAAFTVCLGVGSHLIRRLFNGAASDSIPSSACVWAVEASIVASAMGLRRALKRKGSRPP